MNVWSAMSSATSNGVAAAERFEELDLRARERDAVALLVGEEERHRFAERGGGFVEAVQAFEDEGAREARLDFARRAADRLVGFDQRRLELPLRGERAGEAVIGVGVVGVAGDRVGEPLLRLGKEADAPERFAVERERVGVERMRLQIPRRLGAGVGEPGLTKQRARQAGGGAAQERGIRP